MSPILKRDVSETLRQARRLASAVTGSSDDTYRNNGESSTAGGGGWYRPQITDEVFATGSDRRKGIGIENGDVGWETGKYPDPRHEPLFDAEMEVDDEDGEEMAKGGKREKKGGDGGWDLEAEEGGEGERTRMLVQTSGETRLERLDYDEDGMGPEVSGVKSGQLRDLRNLLFEVSRAHPPAPDNPILVYRSCQYILF